MGVTEVNEPPATPPKTTRWKAVCKDCLREQGDVRAADDRRYDSRDLSPAHGTARRRETAADPPDDGGRQAGAFEYPDRWLRNVSERGGTRSDRCPAHRNKHRLDALQLAAPYVDIDTIDVVADPADPRGPLGGLGPLPLDHERREVTSGLDPSKFAMRDDDVLKLLKELSTKQVALVVAGTGSGKSRFLPYRLLVPPDGAAMRLADRGPIIVTQPRRTAATENAAWIAKNLHKSDVGPGSDIGYKIKGGNKFDVNCGLAFVTDGSLINWLRDGTFTRFGAIIVDEAHERNTNIDVILGFLRANLWRYPELRLIIVSATIDAEFFLQYFGEGDRVFLLSCEGQKQWGYGTPLWPGAGIDEAFLSAWQGDSPSGEPLQDLTARYAKLRVMTGATPVERWREEMSGAVAAQVIRLLEETERGDILGFLPNRRLIDDACASIRRWAIQHGGAHQVDVLPLLSSSPADIQRRACAEANPHGPRRVIIATNVAETSLTISGIRFVVDSGLISQSDWDVETVRGRVPTEPHSQDGLRQRWGRVGRNEPGWVFPLYTEEQFSDERICVPHTPPEATRANLEQFLMTATAAGIARPETYQWPATFLREGADSASAERAVAFRSEVARARTALVQRGAVDDKGDLTALGLELERFSCAPEIAAALILADRLACAIEAATALAVLPERNVIGSLLLFDKNWTAERRSRARTLHISMAQGCTDELELLLKVYGLWETAEDPAAWARERMISDTLLRDAKAQRGELLRQLTPAVNWTRPRPVRPDLAPRVRAVLARAMPDAAFQRDGREWTSIARSEPIAAQRGGTACLPDPDVALAFARWKDDSGIRIANLVRAPLWALHATYEPITFIQRVSTESDHEAHSSLSEHRALHDWRIGECYNVTIAADAAGQLVAVGGLVRSGGGLDNDRRKGARAGAHIASGVALDIVEADAVRDDPAGAAHALADAGNDFLVEPDVDGATGVSEGEEEYLQGPRIDAEDGPEQVAVGDGPTRSSAVEAPHAAKVVAFGGGDLRGGSGPIVVLGYEGIGESARLVVAQVASLGVLPDERRREVRVLESVHGWGPPFLRVLDERVGEEFAVDGSELSLDAKSDDAVDRIEPGSRFEIELLGGGRAIPCQILDQSVSRLQSVLAGQKGPTFEASGRIVDSSGWMKVALGGDGTADSVVFSCPGKFAKGLLQSVGAPVTVRLRLPDGAAEVSVKLDEDVPSHSPRQWQAAARWNPQDRTLCAAPLMPASARDEMLALDPRVRWRSAVWDLWCASNVLEVVSLATPSPEQLSAFLPREIARLNEVYAGRRIDGVVNSVEEGRIFVTGPENTRILVPRERIGPDGALWPAQYLKVEQPVVVFVNTVRDDGGKIAFDARIEIALPSRSQQAKLLMPVRQTVIGTVLKVLERGDVRVSLPYSLQGQVKRGLLRPGQSLSEGSPVELVVQDVRPGTFWPQIDLIPAPVPVAARVPAAQPAAPTRRREAAPTPERVAATRRPAATSVRERMAPLVLLFALALGVASSLFIAFHFVRSWQVQAWEWAGRHSYDGIVRAIDTSSFGPFDWAEWAIGGVAATLFLLLVSAALLRRHSRPRRTLGAALMGSGALLGGASVCLWLFFQIDDWQGQVIRWAWRHEYWGIAVSVRTGAYADISWAHWAIGGAAVAATLSVAARAVRR